MKRVTISLLVLFITAYAQENLTWKKSITHIDGNHRSVKISYKGGFGKTIRSLSVFGSEVNGYKYIISGLEKRDSFNRPIREYMPVPLTRSEYGGMNSYADTAENISELLACQRDYFIDKAMEYYLQKTEYSDTGNPYCYKETEYFDRPGQAKKRVSGVGKDFRLDSDNISRQWKYQVKIDSEGNGADLWTDTLGFVEHRYFQENYVQGSGINEQALDAFFDEKLFASFLDSAYISSETLGHGFDSLYMTDWLRPYKLTINKSIGGRYTMTLDNPEGKRVRSCLVRDDLSRVIAENEYNEYGDLVKSVPPSCPEAPIAAERYDYSISGKQTGVRSPDAGIKRNGYDANGRLLWESDANDISESDTGIVIDSCIVHKYDLFGREIALYKVPYRLRESQDSWVLNNSGRLLLCRAYDDIDNLDDIFETQTIKNRLKEEIGEIENSKGRLVAEVLCEDIDNYTAEVFSYDIDGAVKHTVKLVPGVNPQHTLNTYDKYGRLKRQVFRNGRDWYEKESFYNDNGQLSRIRVNNRKDVSEDSVVINKKDEVLSYKYDELGNVEEKRLGNYHNTESGNKAGIERYKYDLQGRLTSKSLEQSEEDIFSQDLHYQRDAAGNPVNGYSGTLNYIKMDYPHLTEDNTQQVTAYTYDDMGRLVDAERNTGEDFTYSYDILNRFNEKREDSIHTGYTYYDSTSRLKKTAEYTGDHRFVYDRTGNMVLDIERGMHIRYNWRGLVSEYRFYEGLTQEMVGVDHKGECDTEGGVEPLLRSLQEGGSIDIISRVVMFYDASGNRVGKIALKN